MAKKLSSKKIGKDQVKTKVRKQVVIEPPNFEVVQFLIRGNSMYVQNKFSAKAKEQIRIKHEAGSTSKKDLKKEPKDFRKTYEEAMHLSEEGWCGIPAPAFRNAMVSACKVAGFAMTRAKLSVFIEPDGFDPIDGTPLVKITKGKPIPFDVDKLDVVRISGTIDLRARPKWRPGWEAIVRIRYDADQFTAIDVSNLLMRVGSQVGLGEGRPDSKTSCGMGWGLFDIIT